MYIVPNLRVIYLVNTVKAFLAEGNQIWIFPSILNLRFIYIHSFNRHQGLEDSLKFVDSAKEFVPDKRTQFLCVVRKYGSRKIMSS